MSIDPHPPQPYAQFRPRVAGMPLAVTLLAELVDRATAAHDRHDPVDAAGLATLMTATCRELLLGTLEASPHLGLLLRQDPIRMLRILALPVDGVVERATASLGAALATAATLADAQVPLRRFKAETSLAIALADLAGADVTTITRALSRVADTAVVAAVDWAFGSATRRGDWRSVSGAGSGSGTATGSDVSGYFVIAMGKHGAHELNYSSDIDLVVFYEPEPASVAVTGEPQTFFVKLTRDVVKLLSDRTADGYVFRVDLRLRPDPGATQVAMSVPAALNYYESFGQNWERAAMIKARVIAGDHACGSRFLADLQPFVWRRNLDFAAIADIHAMKRQINAFRGHTTVAVAGHNIKLGRGGIREIEFFTQTQQLIAGGRQPDLRTPSTIEALARLHARGWIEAAVQTELGHAYGFLRRLEHRLQMIADEQTQTLPKRDDELDRLARFTGYDDRGELGRALTDTLYTVERHYARLFEAVPDLTSGGHNLVLAGAIDDPDTVETLRDLGFVDPAHVLATVRGWHHGRYAAVSTPRARELLTELQPSLIAALAATVDPAAALAGFDRFLARLPSGVQVFSLLKNTPRLMTVFALLMGSAPRLVGQLSARRRVIDALLDPRQMGNLPTAEELDRLIAADFDAATDTEGRLDAARAIGNEKRFLIGVRLLTGLVTPREAGVGYSLLAERLIVAMSRRVAEDFEATHGRLAGAGFAVVAMGKLGGSEMTASSDLDLIVITETDPDHAQSDGPRPLAANLYVTRWTQRLIAALTAPTAQGPLYDVDLRLRPSGQKGPLATQFASFAEYQSNAAWTWEHMALTRARVICGSADLTRRIDETIRSTLVKPRDRAALATDVHEMRSRIAAAKGSDDIWDLKQVRGGLVDIEFIAQFLQLAHAADRSDVLDVATPRAIERAAAAGVVSPTAADALTAAWTLQSDLMQALRLTLDGTMRAPDAPAGVKHFLLRVANVPSFSALEADLRARQASVRDLFDTLVAPA